MKKCVIIPANDLTPEILRAAVESIFENTNGFNVKMLTDEYLLFYKFHYCRPSTDEGEYLLIYKTKKPDALKGYKTLVLKDELIKNKWSKI